MAEYQTLRIDRGPDGITWLVLNRPEKRNAMNPTMHHELADAVETLEVDDETRVLVVTGAGQAWCAGMDLREYFRDQDDKPKARLRTRHASDRWRELLTAFPKVTIAMVNGWCVGGAFGILHACDLAVAADDAQFCISEVNWGIIPGGTITKVIADSVSWREAMYYILTADRFDGRKAAAMNMVNLSFPADRLRDETIALARKIMEKNPTTLQAAKEALRAVRSMDDVRATQYLAAKSVALRFIDAENGREKGMTEFLDTKAYRPALQPYPRGGGS
jgi:trans-feruloyl-CoA hydratase/vanillin synthase